MMSSRLVGCTAYCAALLMVVGCNKEDADTPSAPNVAKVLAHIHLDNEDSYLTEVRKLGGKMPDYQETIKAEAVDPKSYNPVSVVADIRIDDRPLLWINPVLDHVVVDKKAFTDLQSIRAVMAKHLDAKGQVIGRFLGGKALSPRQIVTFLLKGDVIRSNAHTTAEVYIMSETSGDIGYCAALACVDTYYTNKKNVDTYRYAIAIDLEGTIRLLKE